MAGAGGPDEGSGDGDGRGQRVSMADAARWHQPGSSFAPSAREFRSQPRVHVADGSAGSPRNGT